MTSDHVTFTSTHFAIEPGEDTETNPGIYGRALAAWFAGKLKGRGVTVEEVLAEDFGRCVVVRRKPFRMWVTCASLDASASQWQTYIAVEQTILGRLLGGGKVGIARA